MTAAKRPVTAAERPATATAERPRTGGLTATTVTAAKRPAATERPATATAERPRTSGLTATDDRRRRTAQVRRAHRRRHHRGLHRGCGWARRRCRQDRCPALGSVRRPGRLGWVAEPCPGGVWCGGDCGCGTCTGAWGTMGCAGDRRGGAWTTGGLGLPGWEPARGPVAREPAPQEGPRPEPAPPEREPRELEPRAAVPRGWRVQRPGRRHRLRRADVRLRGGRLDRRGRLLRWDDEVLAGGGPQRDGPGRADADRQRDFQRQHRADTDDRQPATDQQDRPATRLLLFLSEQLFYDDGRGVGVLVRARRCRPGRRRRVSAPNAEVVGQGVLVDRAGARVLGVGQRRGRRGEQRRVRRRQGRTAGQRRLRLLRRAHIKRRHRLQRRLDRGNVDARADQEQPVRGQFQSFPARRPSR